MPRLLQSSSCCRGGGGGGGAVRVRAQELWQEPQSDLARGGPEAQGEAPRPRRESQLNGDQGPQLRHEALWTAHEGVPVTALP